MVRQYHTVSPYYTNTPISEYPKVSRHLFLALDRLRLSDSWDRCITTAREHSGTSWFVTICLLHCVVTTQEFDSSQICASSTPLNPPAQPASPHHDYWSHSQAYYMVLSVWHAPKILIRARALKAWSKETQAAHFTGPGVFKLLVMQSWSYAGLIIDALRAAKDICDVTRTQAG